MATKGVLISSDYWKVNKMHVRGSVVFTKNSSHSFKKLDKIFLSNQIKAGNYIEWKIIQNDFQPSLERGGSIYIWPQS